MRGSLALLCFMVMARAEPNAAQAVWEGPGVTLLGAPSRDGRFLSFAEPVTGNLGLRDLRTGASRILAKASGKQFAYFSTIHPAGEAVAYAWFNEQGFYELRTVDVATGAIRALYSNEEAGFVQPCAYSPDGRQILTLFFRKDNISQIALVPATGGAPRVLKSLNWVYPKKMDFSPDGTQIVYDSFADDRGPDRTLFLLRTDGQGETRLLKTPGNHMFPVWTSAGIVYASGNDLMILAKPGAEPRVWRKGLGRLVPMGATAQGQYFYGLRDGTIDVAVMSLADPAAPARPVSLRFPGRNFSPAWSPDGRQLAYLSRRGMENFGQEHRTVVVRSMQSTEERELDTGLAHISSVRWAADGRALLVAGLDGQGRGGLFRVDPSQPGAELLLRRDEAGPGGVEGAWLNAAALAYLTPEGMWVLAGGKTSEKLAGTGFTNLVARGEELACLSPEGIRWLGAKGAVVLKAPAANLTELAFSGDALLAGNGRELWRVPLDGSPASLLPVKAQRTGRLAVYGERLAYSTGGTRSSIHVLQVPTE